MPIILPERTLPRRWREIVKFEFGSNNPFFSYTSLLNELNLSVDDALQRMTDSFERAISNYTAGTILNIFNDNLKANSRKYADLVEFYNSDYYPFADYYSNEQYSHKRTPNLTSTSTSSGSGTALSSRNQVRTTRTTPETQTVSTHKVDPMDQTGLRNESQDVSVDSGSTSTTDQYTGSPDSTTTQSQASSAVSTSGTDRNEYTKIIHGRDGRRATSETVADGIKAAAMRDILDIIINDIADQIFLQVWT